MVEVKGLFVGARDTFGRGESDMSLLFSGKWIVRQLVLVSLFAAFLAHGGRAAVAWATEAEAPAGSNSVAAAATGEYIIGPADVLEVMLWKEQDLSRQVHVRMDGRISVPLLGDVEAAGKTIDGLAKMLSEQYSKVLEEPAVTVMLFEGRSYKYFVIGKVRTPGEFRIEAPITVLQAIARSGGFVEWAKTADVLLVRKGQGKQEIIHFDYDAFVKGKNIDKNLEIMSGDVIVVP